MTVRPATSGRRRVSQLLGPRGTVVARCLERGLPLPRWGNLRRVEPFSTNFGADRGTPVDRHYLDRFLAAHAADITGLVLEIQCGDYTNRFGHAVSRADTIDIDPRFNATFTTDLAAASTVPSDAYDCFLLPATLQGLRDIDGCLREAFRIVRPGGVILATSASFVPLMTDVPDYWRMSAAGWQQVAERNWPGDIQVRGYGNCLAATASMMGLAAEELSPAELDVVDPRYPVVVSLACRKPGRPAASVDA